MLSMVCSLLKVCLCLQVDQRLEGERPLLHAQHTGRVRCVCKDTTWVTSKQLICYVILIYCNNRTRVCKVDHVGVQSSTQLSHNWVHVHENESHSVPAVSFTYLSARTLQPPADNCVITHLCQNHWPVKTPHLKMNSVFGPQDGSTLSCKLWTGITVDYFFHHMPQILDLILDA